MLWGKRSKRDQFERAVRGVFPSVYNTALRMSRNREEAEDLAQETMVRAYEAFERFDGRNLKAWLLRILTNLFINRYRKGQREPEIGTLETDDGPMDVVDDRADPAAELFDGLLGEEVEEALKKLPEEYRAAVLLTDVEGLSYEETADALGVPIGTVRSRLARGRALLRSELLNYAKSRGYL
ncbi:MAG: ECF RNA polymerase sigma factor SigR [Fimbriimonadales bacterium]|nr:MAG: sigma-70 family RNA polymerase sigma factor [Armatimonadota bacterium]MBV6503518.1 ECF RNA polymerase sigma factor SigR [Fimbriimonadales bacterium]MCE7899485.1 sigma-70 family RNA polymerase sigma factor [Armatimonadetes bacterium ATM1]MDL1929738.1 sigma-70 family RNA polymerase sigma factor [Fimbriimonadia bacterium ATM]MBC6970620.1 RNA polymerase subunit sigma-24 [Armatimonadota bacterium]